MKGTFGSLDVREGNDQIGLQMKLLTEYLERALQLESLADGEADSTFRTELLKQAASYRKLASKRAEQYGLPNPSPAPAGNPDGASKSKSERIFAVERGRLRIVLLVARRSSLLQNVPFRRSSRRS